MPIDASDRNDTPKGDRPVNHYFDVIAVVLMAVGVIILFSTSSHNSIAFFCMFAGFALHYALGLCAGVLSSRFFLFRWYITISRDDSPTPFFLATIVEGIWVVGLFLLFLFSL